jgi:hypothetical protein
MKIIKYVETKQFTLDQWIIKEITAEIIKSQDQIKLFENTIYYNHWNTEKSVLKGMFIDMRTYIKEFREILNKWANRVSQALWKTRTNQTQKEYMERTVISSGQELTKWRLKEQCKESKNEKNLFF